MGSGLLLAGNGTSLLITIAAFLQLLSWPTAGLLILATLAVTILLHASPQKGHIGLPSSLTPGKTPPSRHSEKHASHSQPKQAEHRTQPKQEKTKNLFIKPPPPAPRAQPASPKPLSLTPRTAPAALKPPHPSQPRPKDRTGETPTTIKEGDYLSLDLDLESGNEAVAEVSASGTVNAYVLTEENLTSLDLGQEFWNETESEGVQKASLHFTAPEKGKWFLVVENASSKDVSASVRIHVNQTSQEENA